jgi:hypothetical protein
LKVAEATINPKRRFVFSGRVQANRLQQRFLRLFGVGFQEDGQFLLQEMPCALQKLGCTTG